MSELCIVCCKPSLMKCGKCKDVNYCSVECQSNDLTNHSTLCQGMKDVTTHNILIKGILGAFSCHFEVNKDQYVHARVEEHESTYLICISLHEDKIDLTFESCYTGVIDYVSSDNVYVVALDHNLSQVWYESLDKLSGVPKGYPSCSLELSFNGNDPVLKICQLFTSVKMATCRVCSKLLTLREQSFKGFCSVNCIQYYIRKGYESLTPITLDELMKNNYMITLLGSYCHHLELKKDECLDVTIYRKSDEECCLSIEVKTASEVLYKEGCHSIVASLPATKEVDLFYISQRDAKVDWLSIHEFKSVTKERGEHRSVINLAKSHTYLHSEVS